MDVIKVERNRNIAKKFNLKIESFLMYEDSTFKKIMSSLVTEPVNFGR